LYQAGGVVALVPVKQYRLTVLTPKGVNTMTQQAIKVGFGAPYNVAAAQNKALWAAVTAAITASEGGITLAQLKAVCLANNNPGFANYATKRGWLLPIGAKITRKGVTYTGTVKV
jgi:hypothetical protein